MQSIVPVGELMISTDTGAELVTVVGSCVAVTLYDPVLKVGGMVHIVLPSSRHPHENSDRPSFYADTGIEALITALEKHDADPARLEACVAGGSSTLPDTDIGKRNTTAVLSIIEKKLIPLTLVETGGSRGRKMTFALETGQCRVRLVHPSQTPENPGLPDFPPDADTPLGAGNDSSS